MKPLLQKATVQLSMIVLMLAFPIIAGAQIDTSGRSLGNAQQLTGPYVKNEVLIKFKPSVSAQAKNFSLSQVAAVNLGSVNKRGLIRVQLSEGHSVDDALETFGSMDDVESVQPNYIYKAFAVTPNDTEYDNLWGLKNSGQTVSDESYSTNNPGTSGKDMDLENAWENITNCSSVVVAVIDSGVNYNQEDLVDNMWDGGASYPNHGYDFVDSDNDPMDRNGHGTHVAGTIGAVGNNATGSTGICWSVQLMAVRVLGSNGSGTTADIVSGVDFAVNNSADVINMSLGNNTYDAQFYSALSDAREAGIIVVVAAGNDGNDNDGSTETYPCNYNMDNESLICVAALDQSYELASFSNYGEENVDVGAPGTNICSTWPGTTVETTDDFSSGWTTAGDWTVVAHPNTGDNVMANPSTWYGGGSYGISINESVYKSFTIASADVVLLSQDVYIDVDSNDYWVIFYDEDPFNNQTQLVYATNYDSGSNGGTPVNLKYELEDCESSTTCGIKYNMQTDGNNDGGNGVGIWTFSLTTLAFNTNSYDTIDGTSMASPHVAGLAAMIKAYNPNYDYLDILESIKEGGDSVSSLDGTTSTGKAVDAYGSLKYIQAPTGLSVSVK